MIYRLHNPKILAAAVKEHAADLVRGFSPIDWLLDTNHIALTDGRNIGLFEAQKDPGVFVGHTLFQDRGKVAIEAGRKIVRALFKLFGAKIIRGETPLQQKAARWFNRQIGFHSEGFKSTPHGDVELFVLECR